MPSETEIANLALSHLGVSTDILNLETERSVNARACRKFYDTARDKVLRDFPWGFATKIAALGLIEQTPNDEWLFSYQYPSDCLYFKKIQSGNRNDSRQSIVPFKEAQSASSKVIYTDKDEAVAEYTIRAEDSNQWPPDFVLAYSYLLASYVAPLMTGGDPFKRGESAFQKYLLEISEAQRNSSNEEKPDEAPESEFISARN